MLATSCHERLQLSIAWAELHSIMPPVDNKVCEGAPVVAPLMRVGLT